MRELALDPRYEHLPSLQVKMSEGGVAKERIQGEKGKGEVSLNLSRMNLGTEILTLNFQLLSRVSPFIFSPVLTPTRAFILNCQQYKICQCTGIV